MTGDGVRGRIGPAAFLRARLDEVETFADQVTGPDDETYRRAFNVNESVKVVRAILDHHDTRYGDDELVIDQECCADQEPWPCRTVRLLLSLHDAHPDYDQDWAPESGP